MDDRLYPDDVRRFPPQCRVKILHKQDGRITMVAEDGVEHELYMTRNLSQLGLNKIYILDKVKYHSSQEVRVIRIVDKTNREKFEFVDY